MYDIEESSSQRMAPNTGSNPKRTMEEYTRDRLFTDLVMIGLP